MPISYVLGANPEWYVPDQNGDPLAGGYISFYRDVQRDTFKAVYQDAGGVVEYTNPVQITGAGVQGPFYFADDEAYYIVFSRSFDFGTLQPVDIIRTISGYTPGVGGGAPVTTILDIENFIVNGQFRSNLGDKEGSQLFPTEHELEIAAGGWSFFKDDGSATDTLKFVPFVKGQITVPANPPVYLEYNVTVAATGETEKYIAWKVKDATTFASQDMTLSFEARSVSSNDLEVKLYQNFGTGGAPSAENIQDLDSFSLTNSWQHLDVSFTTNSVNGKTFGTNGDDWMGIAFRITPDSLYDLKLTNVQLEIGSIANDFVTETPNDVAERSIGAILPPITDADTNKVLTVERFYNPYQAPSSPILAWSYGVPVGSMLMWGTDEVAALPPGWFFCDGSTQFRYLYQLLFRALFNTSIGGPLWGIKPELSFNIDVPVANPYKLLTYLPAQSPDTTIPAPTNGTIPALTFALVQAGSPTLPQIYNVTFPAATSINAGAYWTASTNGASIPQAQYYIWYTKNGEGVDPAVGGKIGLRVDIDGADTGLQVAQKSSEVLIDTVFLLPDLRDFFVRGWDSSNQPGVQEAGQVGLHNHKMNVYDFPPDPPSPSSRPSGRYLSTVDPLPPPANIYNGTHNGNTLADDAIDLGHTGVGSENRPPNQRIVFIIKHD